MGRLKNKLLLNHADASYLLGISDKQTLEFMKERSIKAVEIAGTLYTSRKQLESFVDNIIVDGEQDNDKIAGCLPGSKTRTTKKISGVICTKVP